MRTVVVNQGLHQDARSSRATGTTREFLVPTLYPETVAESIVKQVLTGESGQIILPAFGTTLTALAAMPHWYQYRMRKRGQAIMTNFQGRQVVKDLDQFYADKEKEKTSIVEESTVLVSGPEIIEEAAGNHSIVVFSSFLDSKYCMYSL